MTAVWIVLAVAILLVAIGFGIAQHQKHGPGAITLGAYTVSSRDKVLYVMGTDKGNSLQGASAEIDNGSAQSRMTGTRVLGGALIAGPAGAIVGGLARKDKSKVYVTVHLVEPQQRDILITVPAAQETMARRFVTQLNNIAVSVGSLR